jgi:uncharacterized membrane protein
MERIKEILKIIITFVLILLSISQLKYILVYEIFTKITGDWTTLTLTSDGFPKICYLSLISYVIIFIMTYLIHKFLFKNKRLFTMAIIGVILLFANNMFGVFGCFWFCLD